MPKRKNSEIVLMIQINRDLATLPKREELEILINKKRNYPAHYYIPEIIIQRKVSNIGQELLDGHVVELLDVKQHPLVVAGDKVDGNSQINQYN
jgi:hypothetical protein